MRDKKIEGGPLPSRRIKYTSTQHNGYIIVEEVGLPRARATQIYGIVTESTSPNTKVGEESSSWPLRSIGTWIMEEL